MKFICFLWFALISFFSAANSYTIFEEHGKVGLKNAQGQVLIPAAYDALGWSDGTFSIVDNVTGYFLDNRWGLISISNNRITKSEFEEICPGEGSILTGRKKSNLSLRLATGCINTEGKVIIPFYYDGLSISHLRAIVFTKIGNQFKYGLVDLENKTLIPQQYQHIKPIGNLRYAVLNFEGKAALFSDAGKQITAFDIDSLSSFKKNYAILYQGVYKGLIDRDGVFKLDAKYREINIHDDGTISARLADDWLVLDGANKLIREIKADSLLSAGRNLMKVKVGNVVKLTDHTFNPITKSTFSEVRAFNKGKALYKWENYFGLLSADGSILVPAIYRNLIIGENYLFANQPSAGKNAWLLLDTLGVKRKEKTFEEIRLFHHDFFAVRNRGFWGVLNKTGDEIISCTYDSLIEAKDKYVVVKFHGEYGIIDFEEDWVVTPQRNKIKLIGNERYVEITNPTTFLKSIDGNTIYFSDNKLELYPEFMLEYLPSGTVWKIDMNGLIADRQVYPEEITEKVYEEAEGYRGIKRNGKYGFIDSRGRLRIANRYEGLQSFSEGLAAVKILGKWGFINLQDNIAVQPSYEEVFPFRNGYAVVKQKGLYGIVDRTGKNVLPIRYDRIEVLPTKNYKVTVDKLVGLADATGKLMLNPKYNSLEELGNGYVIVERDGKYGVTTLQGISTIPLIYDYINFDRYNNYFLAMKKASWISIH